MSRKKELSDISFFIASTQIDLSDYRQAVIEKIRSKSGVINAHEFFGARDQKPLTTCLEEVGKSQVFIMIIGMRYGSVVSNKSYVEHEYQRAKDLNIYKLVYFIDEDHPIPSKYVDRNKNAGKLSDFKKELLNDFTIEKFTTPDNLAEKVLQDLIRELPKNGFDINVAAAEQQQELGLKDMLTHFKMLPKVYYGQEFSASVQFERSDRADESECSALSLTYGAAVKRFIKSDDDDMNDVLAFDLGHVFAQHDLAQKLIELPYNQTFRIKVKTVQGTHRKKEPIYGRESSGMGLASHLVITSNPMVITGYENEDELIYGLELLDIETG